MLQCVNYQHGLHEWQTHTIVSVSLSKKTFKEFPEGTEEYLNLA